MTPPALSRAGGSHVFNYKSYNHNCIGAQFSKTSSKNIIINHTFPFDLVPQIVIVDRRKRQVGMRKKASKRPYRRQTEKVGTQNGPLTKC